MFYSRISVEFFFFIQYLHKFLLYTNHVIHVTWFSWVGRMYRQTGNREPDQFTGKRITVNSRHPHRRREWHCPAGRIFLLRLCRDKGPPICAVTRTLVSQSHCSPMSSLVLTAPYSISTTATTVGQRKALPCTHPWGWRDTLFLVVVQSLSRVQLFVTLWTAALQTFPVPYHLLEFAQVHVHCMCYLYTNTKTIMKSFWVCSDHQHQLHSWPGNIFLRGPVCFDLASLPPRHPHNSCTAVVLGL